MKMRSNTPIQRIKTGIRHFDEILDGGFPKGSMTLIGGSPGAGKTIFSQQICFYNATPERPAVFFQTLAEPTFKTLRFVKNFPFFDPDKLSSSVHFIDLSNLKNMQGVRHVIPLVSKYIKKIMPAFIVVDSFKALDDLDNSREKLRKLSYELMTQGMVWECTCFLIGEYSINEMRKHPIASIADGMISLTRHEVSGEQQRFVRVIKMRGVHHSLDKHPFKITPEGIEVYPPRVILPTQPKVSSEVKPINPRCLSGIDALDSLLEGGIPRGSSLLLAGIAGTGKTLTTLEFLYRGAKEYNEKGIFFSFEETEERLLIDASSMGWDLTTEIERKMIEIVFIPQPEIAIERHLLMIKERVSSFGAKRVVVDSLTIFLHKVKLPEIAREKMYQLETLVRNESALGLFTASIPYGANFISRFGGVEETIVDGIIFLSLIQKGGERQRYIEIFKLRNTKHKLGRFKMELGRHDFRSPY